MYFTRVPTHTSAHLHISEILEIAQKSEDYQIKEHSSSSSEQFLYARVLQSRKWKEVAAPSHHDLTIQSPPHSPPSIKGQEIIGAELPPESLIVTEIRHFVANSTATLRGTSSPLPPYDTSVRNVAKSFIHDAVMNATRILSLSDTLSNAQKAAYENKIAHERERAESSKKYQELKKGKKKVDEDLQAALRNNAELLEKGKKLQEELAGAKKAQENLQARYAQYISPAEHQAKLEELRLHHTHATLFSVYVQNKGRCPELRFEFLKDKEETIMEEFRVLYASLMETRKMEVGAGHTDDIFLLGGKEEERSDERPLGGPHISEEQGRTDSIITPKGSSKKQKKPLVMQMEKLREDDKVDVLDESLLRMLTEEFNSLPARKGKKAIQMTQVQRLFRKRKRFDTESTNSPISSESLDSSTDTHNPNNVSSERSGVEKSSEQEFDFEARSSTDHAWYDVAAFLNHRISSSGELEVKVKFPDFDSVEDEWVNVKKDVRERSIPLESKECPKVEVGNLVLCFRESYDVALYFDAHVVEIQRKLHDIGECSCVFLVRYDHDQMEEKVNLRKICRRPTCRSVES